MNYYKNNIRHVKGDTLSFGLVVEGLGKNLDSAYFTCRDGKNDDSVILFQKMLGDGITITEEEEDVYKYAVRVDPNDTYDLQTGTYFYDLEIRVNSDVFTIMRGNFVIEQDATRDGEDIKGKYAPRWINFASYSGTDLKYEVANINTINIKNMTSMFDECSYLTSLDLSNWDTSNVWNMSYMFHNCSRLTSLDLSNWDTSFCRNMSNMFQGCSRLTSLDLSNLSFGGSGGGLNISASNMFNGCSHLTFLDVRKLEFSRTTSYTNMLSSVPTTCEIIVKDDIEKQWFNTNFTSYSNVKTVAEL